MVIHGLTPKNIASQIPTISLMDKKDRWLFITVVSTIYHELINY